MMHTFSNLRRSRLAGIFCISAGLFCNKFVLEALFSGDGNISAVSVNIALVALQLCLILAGILYFTQAYRALSRLGIGLLLLFVAQFWGRVFLDIPHSENRMFSALPTPPSVFEAGLAYQDQISRYEARFNEIKTMLPSSGSVGYVTSAHLPPSEAKFHDGLVTYTLAPLLVERTTAHPFVIGNFPNSNQETRHPSFEGMNIIKDFGNGVVLFSGKDTP